MRKSISTPAIALWALIAFLGLGAAAAAQVQAPIVDLRGADEIFANLDAAVLASPFEPLEAMVLTPLGSHRGVALYQIAPIDSRDAFYAYVRVGKNTQLAALARVAGVDMLLPQGAARRDGWPDATASLALRAAALPGPLPLASPCQPDGGFDDTLSLTRCCSGVAVNGSTSCFNAADFGTTWKSCSHVCGSRLVGGCVPSGKVDDTLFSTNCCSGVAVPGSTRCLNPADYGTTWRSCIQTCQ